MNRHDSQRPTRILFVCLGNICRSPAAEGVMRALAAERGLDATLTIDSAGTGRWHVGQLADPRMRSAARRRGIELTHRCRQVCSDDFDDFDLIIGMDANNVADLKRLAPTAEGAAKVLGIGRWLDSRKGYDYVPDPYYEGAEGFELVLDLLEDACNRMLDQWS